MYFLWECFYLFPNSIFPYYKTRHITRKSSGLYKFDDWCNIINMVVRIFVEWDGVWLYCLDDDVTAMIRVGLVSSSHWSPGSTPTHSHLWRGRVTIWIISHQLHIQLTYPSLTGDSFSVMSPSHTGCPNKMLHSVFFWKVLGLGENIGSKLTFEKFAF